MLYGLTWIDLYRYVAVLLLVVVLARAYYGIHSIVSVRVRKPTNKSMKIKWKKKRNNSNNNNNNKNSKRETGIRSEANARCTCNKDCAIRSICKWHCTHAWLSVYWLFRFHLIFAFRTVVMQMVNAISHYWISFSNFLVESKNMNTIHAVWLVNQTTRKFTCSPTNF